MKEPSVIDMREQEYWKSLIHVKNEKDTLMMSLVWVSRERRQFISPASTANARKKIMHSLYRSVDSMLQRLPLEVDNPEYLE